MEQIVTRFLATSIAALALALPFQAQAEPLGAHPAVIVAERGPGAYDYAAKFYPHPARLELLAHAPRAAAEHPAVLVARTWSNRGIDPNHFIPAHPARLEFVRAETGSDGNRPTLAHHSRP